MLLRETPHLLSRTNIHNSSAPLIGFLLLENDAGHGPHRAKIASSRSFIGFLLAAKARSDLPSPAATAGGLVCVAISRPLGRGFCYQGLILIGEVFQASAGVGY